MPPFNRPRLYRESVAEQTNRIAGTGTTDQQRYASQVVSEFCTWLENARLRGVQLAPGDVRFLAESHVVLKQVVLPLREAAVKTILHLVEGE